MRIYIETYGCALNRADESIMKTVLTGRGHEIVSSLEHADVIVINTCTVRLDTELRMIKRIKQVRDFCRAHGKKLVVAGCMARAQPYKISKIAPEASLISPQNSSKIYLAIEKNGRVVILDGDRDRNCIGLWVEKGVAYIPLQDGCTGNCSFCIVKNARRNLVSYPIEKIIDAIKKAVASGAVEIELTGQDTASYGLDLYGSQKLPELLERIDDLPGNFMVRMGMMNPDTLRNILDQVTETLRQSRRIYHFLHIPLQSGSNEVLKIMRRRYTVEEYVELVKELRRKIPGISIATDIIVGHPGEEEEDFEATIDIIKKLEFERVHVAVYSIRPNTLSARMPQVPTKTKKNRMLRLLRVVEEVGYKVHARYIGSTLNVFITEKTNKWIGRTRNYIPVIILDNSSSPNYGKHAKVFIKDATFYDLRGEIVH